MVFDPNYDLALLKDRFTECGTYTKDVILEELKYWQTQENFFCLVDGRSFMVGYPNRDSLWLAQVYNDGSLSLGRAGFEFAKNWAMDMGLKSITGETKRNEMRAMQRYGFEEYSVIMRCPV